MTGEDSAACQCNQAARSCSSTGGIPASHCLTLSRKPGRGNQCRRHRGACSGGPAAEQRSRPACRCHLRRMRQCELIERAARSHSLVAHKHDATLAARCAHMQELLPAKFRFACCQTQAVNGASRGVPSIPRPTTHHPSLRQGNLLCCAKTDVPCLMHHQLPQPHLEDLNAPKIVWQRHIHNSVKAARPNEGWVQNVFSVGCRHHDDLR